MTILAGHGEKAMATSPENGFLQETRFLGELRERKSIKTLQNIRLMLLSRVHHNWRLVVSWRVATNWKVRHSSKSIIPHKYHQCYLSSQNFPLEQPTSTSLF